MSDDKSAARALYNKARQVAETDNRACLKFLLQAYEKDPKRKYMDKIIQLRQIIAESDPSAESSDSESSDDIILIGKLQKLQRGLLNLLICQVHEKRNRSV